MSERRISGTVTDNCQFKPDHAPSWLATLSDLRGQRVVVTVEREKKARSTQQNKYYWSCVVPIFQEMWSHGRAEADLEPLTKDETHEVLVQVLLGSEDGPLPGSRIRKRTSSLSSTEFAQYVDKCRELALHQYGFEIPPAGEEITA